MEAPQLQAELTDERRRLLVTGGRVSPEIRLSGWDRQHPGLLIGVGLGVGPLPPKAPSKSSVYHQQASWEGGRAGTEESAQRLAFGVPGAEEGAQAQLPPTLTSFLGEHPALCLVLSHLPTTGQPQLRPRRAYGPLNKGWPLLVIKISEETLKRKPLGLGLGRPQAALPGEGTGHSSWLWKAAQQGARSTLLTLTRSSGADRGVG